MMDFRNLFTPAQFHEFIENELNRNPNHAGGCPRARERYSRLAENKFRPALARLIQARHAEGGLQPVTSLSKHRFLFIDCWNKALQSKPNTWRMGPWIELADLLIHPFLVPSIMTFSHYGATEASAYEHLVENVNAGRLIGVNSLDTFCALTGARADFEIHNWTISLLPSSKGLIKSDLLMAA